MIVRVLRLVRAELLKLGANRFLYVSLAILALVAAGVVGVRLRLEGESPWRGIHALHLLGEAFRWSLDVATYVLLVFSAMTFSGEFDRGTVKNLLTRPVTRTDVFLAKTAVVVLLGIFLYLFVLLASAVPALWAGELGHVWDEEQGTFIRSFAELRGRAGETLVVCFLPFLAAGFVGLTVSTWTESSGYAVAIALVLLIVGGVFVDHVLPHGAQKYAFLYHAPRVLGKFTDLAAGGNELWDLEKMRGTWAWVPLVTDAVCAVPAYVLFRWRNITV